MILPKVEVGLVPEVEEGLTVAPNAPDTLPKDLEVEVMRESITESIVEEALIGKTGIADPRMTADNIAAINPTVTEEESRPEEAQVRRILAKR